MQTLGSTASVIAAILEDASAEVERIEQATSRELAGIRREGETANVAIADREARLHAARRAGEERLAEQEWQGRKALIEQREAWIASVIAAARAREIAPAERDARLRALVDEARREIGSADCTITLDDAGGCIATAGDVTFDNTLAARARRFESQWRNALAAMYRLEATP